MNQAQENQGKLLFAELHGLLGQTTDNYLYPPLDEQMSELLDVNQGVISGLTLDQQLDFLKLSLSNFGLFVTAREVLAFMPGPLKYAYISEAMNEQGACGTPSEFVNQVNDLLSQAGPNFWRNPQTSDAAYTLRELIVANPYIGVEPLLDEFSNCGDVDLLIAMLSNPVCPRELRQSIKERTHFIFEEYEEDELEELLEVVQNSK